MTRKPNVVICMCDQLRAFEIGCYGNRYIATPNMDKLAEDGFRFNTAVTNTPVCTPARANLISGQYSRTCAGSTNNRFADYPEQERKRIPGNTLAEQLKTNGYKTALIGKWHLYTDPLKMGFDYACYPKVPHVYYNQTFYENSGEGTVIHDFSPDYESEKVKEYIHDNKEDPFFLYYNISLPHMPVLRSIAEKCLNKYTRNDVKLRENVWTDNKLPFDEWWFKVYLNDFQFYNKAFAGASEDEMREYDLPQDFNLYDLTALYANLVTYSDILLGQLMNVIKKNGLNEDTILVFTSDHGDNLGSHGFFNKERLTEESIRIPFIINYPGKVRNDVDITNIAQLIDIMPTVLELTGCTVPQGVQGRSLSGILRGEKADAGENYVFIETPFNQTGIRTPEYLYGIQLSENGKEIIDDSFCFYDLVNDPYQMDNLAKAQILPDMAEKLRNRLTFWHKNTPWFSEK